MPPKKASKSKASPSATAATNRPKRASAITAESKLVATPSTERSPTATKKRARTSKDASGDAEPPSKRGRTAKSATSEPVSTAKTPTAAKKSKASTSKEAGRVAKDKAAVPRDEKAPPKKRGKPPKGGETTKISRDDIAAAEQLEEELVEAVEEEPSKLSSPRVEVKPAKSNKAQKAKVAKSTAEDGARPVGSDRKFFLMKAEQEDRFETLKSGREFNTRFTIDDLRGKGQPEMWDARNVMNEMSKGDLAFFYASGGRKGRKPAITGIMEIVEEAQPDPTTYDEDAIGYVEKESDRDKWVIVHVEYRKKLRNPVTLDTLKQHANGGGRLSDLHVFRAARLSVSRVSSAEWDFIVNELIGDDYEDES